MYDHYISLDWAQKVMALARISGASNKLYVTEQPANISDLRAYLTKLKGSKIFTFEETTTAQWLFTEVGDLVDEVIVCDPYRNSLLSEGPKTDKIDAVKLVKLLKANLLKPVFHCSSDFFAMRKLVSGYDDVIKRGVRLKNQRLALLRAHGHVKSSGCVNNKYADFVLHELEISIKQYALDKKKYVEEFSSLTKQHVLLRNLHSIPGIGIIGAIKLGAIIVNGERFPDRNHFLSYCGLVRHDRMSGGHKYGSKQPRYNRMIKSVIKSAAMSVLDERHSSIFKEYYQSLCVEKSYSTHNARHALARRIATVVYGVFKSKKRFTPERAAPMLKKA